MSDKPPLKQDLIDSLLQSMYQTDEDHARSLVSVGMQRISDDQDARSTRDQATAMKSTRRWLIMAFAAAAVILMGVALPLLDDSRRATAAVKQSLKQAFEDIGRHYRTQTTWRTSEGTVQRLPADLYVRGADQFALRLYGPLQQVVPIWLGSNPKYSWVMLPAGPVLEGDRRSLTDWFQRRQNRSTPYLHITTALELMCEHYELQSLNDTKLDVSGNSIRCRRVTGTLKRDSADQRPQRIDLWLDGETGVVMKLHAAWDLEQNQWGRESTTIVFVKQTELSDAFFTPEIHGGNQCPRINFSSGNEQ